RRADQGVAAEFAESVLFVEFVEFVEFAESTNTTHTSGTTTFLLPGCAIKPATAAILPGILGGHG
ncbi:hypothetical protein ACWIFI_06875, partial [Streptomyces albidoflavus]